MSIKGFQSSRDNGISAQLPNRQIRADYTDNAIVVYQAYSDEIADKALQAQRFLSPFRFDRMTWIKPSFLWMMYRSGWGAKTGQTRILAIDITLSGFRWCLENACLRAYPDNPIYNGKTSSFLPFWHPIRDYSDRL